MAGFASPLWFTGLASPPAPDADGGVRSLLAPWVGGASAPPAPAETGGVRSLLAPWIGGASAVPLPVGGDSGVRSLLAFWAGGAANDPDIAPPDNRVRSAWWRHRYPQTGPVQYRGRDERPRRHIDYAEFFGKPDVGADQIGRAQTSLRDSPRTSDLANPVAARVANPGSVGRQGITGKRGARGTTPQIDERLQAVLVALLLLEDDDED